MTLSLLMYTLMIATAVTLSSVLVADTVRGLSRRYARRSFGPLAALAAGARAAGLVVAIGRMPRERRGPHPAH